MSAVVGCECLHTQVRNISGGTMHFSFLPYHGRNLADQETFLIDGDPFDAFPRTMLGIRNRQALCRAIQNSWLEIVYTRPPIGECPPESSAAVSSSSSSA